MSLPKRHHFVPQFYLRRFSQEVGSIICYHKASRKLIPRASIKGQCAIDNFYSWNERVETALSTIEGRAAAIFREIDQSGFLPIRMSADYQELLIFIALQSSRTQLSGRESDDMADYMYKLMARGHPELDGVDLDSIRIGSNFPSALPMQNAILTYPMLNKLGSSLLINNTAFPFITSDNPVFFYNSQRAHIQWRGIIGLSSKGLQIIYPISPNKAIYLYDTDVYRPPSNTGQRKIRLEDAIKINLGHYMWSGEVAFIDSMNSAHPLEKIAATASSFLPYHRSQNRESELVEAEGQYHSLLHSFRAHIPLECDFSFARHDKNLSLKPECMRDDVYVTPLEPGDEGQSYTFTASQSDRAQLSGNELNLMIKQIVKFWG
jgi:hypothetical protein